MSMAQLLIRGMLVGLVAGLLAFTFARVYGEPNVNRSIAVEEALDKAKGEAPDPELVSRAVQASIGLFTGVVVVGTALGGIFSLLFAVCYGRFSSMGPRTFAALLGLICFVAIFMVPDLKYPANPPAIGQPDTIGIRTGLYFSMIAISVIATIAAFSLRRMLIPKFTGWNASLIGVLAFIVMIAVSYYALPVVNEVPETFPAQTLWSFRLDSIGIQVILWGTVSLLFGYLTERSLERQRLSTSHRRADAAYERR